MEKPNNCTFQVFETIDFLRSFVIFLNIEKKTAGNHHFCIEMIQFEVNKSYETIG